MDAAPNPTPFDLIGGEAKVFALAEAFYDIMRRDEPALADLHRCEPDGRVSQDSRDRFALFLVGWLGGPQRYIAQFGHPRLRMRHAHVPVDLAMRDAWLRAMKQALDAQGVEGKLRAFIDARFTDMADFMRNVDEG